MGLGATQPNRLLAVVAAFLVSAASTADDRYERLAALADVAPFPVEPLKGRWERDTSAPPNVAGYCSAILSGIGSACDQGAQGAPTTPQLFKYEGFAKTWSAEEARVLLGQSSVCVVGDSLARQFAIQLVCLLTPTPLSDDAVQRSCTPRRVAFKSPKGHVVVGNTTVKFAGFQTFPTLAEDGRERRNAWFKSIQVACPEKTTDVVVLGVGSWHVSWNDPISLDEYARRLDFALGKFAGVPNRNAMFPRARLFYKPTLPLPNGAALRPNGFCATHNGSAFPSVRDAIAAVGDDASNWTSKAHAANVIVNLLTDREGAFTNPWTMLGGSFGEELFGAALSHPCAHVWKSREYRCDAEPPSNESSDPVHFCMPDDGRASPVLGFLVNNFLDALARGGGGA